MKLAGHRHNLLQAERWLKQMYPAEEHNIGGDCINPNCDYEFTDEDTSLMARASGWFTCPQCGKTYNYLDPEIQQQTNRVGLTNSEMGAIGESVVGRLGTIPELGPITWISYELHSPIDLIAGEFGVEVKTIHSEAQPRFKLGGGGHSEGYKFTKKDKLEFVEKEGLRPAIVGVRLNFHKSIASLFVRRDSFTDTWIGAKALIPVGDVRFDDLNPFKNDWEVPPPSQLPEDDEDENFDSDIPF
jgi:hypothetical protein